MSAAPSSRLYRLDDQLWSLYPRQEGVRIPPEEFEELRLMVPKLSDGKERYELISTVRATFEANPDHLKRDWFRKGFRINIENPESSLAGTWDVGLHRRACLSRRICCNWIRRIKQSFPFTRSLSKRRTAVIDIHRIKECLPSRMLSATQRVVTLSAGRWNHPTVLEKRLPASVLPEESITLESFRDPFTKLAKEALVSICPFFVMETSHRDGYRFVLNENELFLERLIAAEADVLRQTQRENRTVVQEYRDFLVREYGRDFVDYIELAYKIDFEGMIQRGDPLMPDHVSKCNIGANNIEIKHIEDLWHKVKKLFHILQVPHDPEEPAASFLLREGQKLGFPLRVLRNLLRLVSRAGRLSRVAELKTFLDSLIGLEPSLSARSLAPAYFNKIVAMLMPSESERVRSFTGRKIRHLCVMGYHTMGQPHIPNPCRDLFELLHIFPDLRKNKWKNFYELLSHVVCKKSLYRENQEPDAAGQTIRTGLLIPGPNDDGRANQWFYVDGFYDDSKGNVNYVLLPACDGYNQPLIKLYRSTSTNRNAENSYDSVMADLNPKGPGSMSPELSLPYERDHFFERTIPIWMGCLILARTAVMRLQQGNDPRIEAERASHLKKAVEAFKRYSKKLPREGSEEAVASITASYENKRFDDLEKELVAIGHKYREDPRYKKPQDMALVGHSLGATLAQQGMYYFSTFYERMPLPHHQFTCYSSDGPAVTNDQDLEFMRFGRSNRELFKLLGVKWRIYHQFEAGDLVPQSGGSHLGTTGYDEYGDRDWLRETVGVFSPLEEAKALSIVSPPTHGRRIGTAIGKIDYIYTRISPQDLGEYDHSFFLSKKLRRVWQYRILNSPRTTEKIRSVAGTVLQKIGFLHYLDNVGGNGVGQRDGNGVLAVRYTPTLPAPSPALA